jgi:hypothetical protein
MLDEMTFRPLRVTAVLLALAAVPSLLRAQGGPPLMTDDPGTPDAGTWEVNVAVTGDLTSAGRGYELPVFDVNYGAGGHVQLTVSVPLAVSRASHAGTHGDVGEVEAGAKWRFIDQGGAWPADVSAFPKIVFHPPVAGPGEGTEVLLPLEAARAFGSFALNVDAGRIVQRHASGAWFYGAALQYAPAERMQWLAELHTETGGDAGAVRFLNAGFRRDLDAHRVLLFSIGHNVFRGDAPAETVAYLGVQFHGKP